jgi:hypothetical protein
MSQAVRYMSLSVTKKHTSETNTLVLCLDNDDVD